MQLPSIPQVDDIYIRELWLSAYILPTVSVANELGIFDLLENGVHDEKTIALELNLNPMAAGVFIATLKSLGLIVENDNRLELTSLSRHYLVRASPYYWGHMFHWFKDLPLSHDKCLQALRASVGQVSESWEAGEFDAKQAESIAAAMNSHSIVPALGLAAQLDLSGIDAVLDIGGGGGYYSLAMAGTNKKTKFDIAELPAICLQAKKNIALFNMQHAVGTIEFNMFVDEWPKKYGAFFFANVLHDWDLDRCTYLIQQSFNALPANGKIFIFEMLINDTGDGPLISCLFSMSMLLNTKGKQFSGAELTQLLESAGFIDITIDKPISGYSLIKAQKPS